MKTIELPDSLADALIRIGHELAVQDNLHTSWPIWVVMERKKVYVGSDFSWDEKERVDSDYIDEDLLCADCKKAMEENELPQTCESDMCDDGSYNYFNWEDQPSFWKGPGMFLTQKACQEHIDSNRYDYTDPRTYAYSAHRNYEIQPIIQALIVAAGHEVPSNQYGRIEE